MQFNEDTDHVIVYNYSTNNNKIRLAGSPCDNALVILLNLN